MPSRVVPHLPLVARDPHAGPAHSDEPRERGGNSVRRRDTHPKDAPMWSMSMAREATTTPDIDRMVKPGNPPHGTHARKSEPRGAHVMRGFALTDQPRGAHVNPSDPFRSVEQRALHAVEVESLDLRQVSVVTAAGALGQPPRIASASMQVRRCQGRPEPPDARLARPGDRASPRQGSVGGGWHPSLGRPEAWRWALEVGRPSPSWPTARRVTTPRQ